MQRIDYNVQTPLQLARVDERIDEDSGQWIVLGFFDQYVLCAVLGRLRPCL